MTASQVLMPRQVFYDPNGAPLAGGAVYTYASGTTTSIQTWANASQSTLNTNPIILDAAGSCLIFATGPVQFVVHAADGTLIPAYSGLTYAFGSGGGGVNIVAFGADPTGTTDSTNAIKNAWAALGSLGGSCYWPVGTYLITSGQLNLQYPIYNYGDGMHATTITSNNPTGDYFAITSLGPWFDLIGFSCNVKRTAGAYINMTGGGDCGISRFYMEKYFVGVDLSAGYNGWVQTGNMRNCAGGTNSCGILIDGGNAQYISEVTMDNPDTVSVQFAGIWIRNSGAVNMTDLDIIQCNNDLYITAATGVVIASIWAVDCFFDTANAGISISTAGGGTIVRCRFTGCWTSSHQINGVYIDSTSGGGMIGGIEFDGHHAFGCISNNITVHGSSTHDVRFNGGASAGCVAGSGIFIDSNVSYFAIQNMKLGGGFGYAGNKVGISVAAGTGDQYMITANDLTNNTSAAMTVLASGTNTVVANNLTV